MNISITQYQLRLIGGALDLAKKNMTEFEKAVIGDFYRKARKQCNDRALKSLLLKKQKEYEGK